MLRTAVRRTTRSRGGLSEQFGQTDEIVGGHCQGELPADLGQAAMAHLAQTSDGFGPPKGFLDALADALGDFVADMPSGS